MLFDSILPTVDLLAKLEPVLLNPASSLSAKFIQYSKFFVVILTFFTASSSGISRSHLKKPLSYEIIAV